MSLPQKVLEPENIHEKIQRLLRGNGKELDAYLTKVTTQSPILDTEAKVHCYMVGHDGNDFPRVQDLAQAVAIRLMDYAIPRSELLKAQEEDRKYNTTAAVTKLKIKARKLFTALEKTGEGGEMLLYMLVQSYLGLPQLLCKMPLKTSGQVHYQGADGIHVGYDTTSKKLALYWGEAKMYQSLDQAITNCLDSLAPYLCGEGGSDNPRLRDMQLIMTHLDLCDDVLEEAVLKFLNPDDPSYKKLQYRGACLIGFDHKSYPKGPYEKTEELVLEEIEKSFTQWQGKLGKNIKSRSPLDRFVLEVFMVPFPSVQDFRDAFLGELQYV
jgi:hypothetical protein